jgi:hypothetical protein
MSLRPPLVGAWQSQDLFAGALNQYLLTRRNGSDTVMPLDIILESEREAGQKK